MNDEALKRAEWVRALDRLIYLEIERDELEKKFLKVEDKEEKANLKNKMKMLQDLIDEADKNEEEKWKKYMNV